MILCFFVYGKVPWHEKDPSFILGKDYIPRCLQRVDIVLHLQVKQHESSFSSRRN